MQPPQTPLASSSRDFLTPHKTPFRTPLRTPGGSVRGEQLSHTPVINFEAIEQHKENVQPLARGRSAHALTTALSQRYAELKAQRAEWEALVTSEENADADDPLEAWMRYVKWCVDSYPGGQTSESGLVLLLERCTRLFRHSAQYRNDSRYLRLWIQYARHVDCPADVYNFLLANEIGTALASLYEELAAVYEAQGAHDKADETYRVGIHRTAQPIDRLKRRYKEYQARVLSAEGRDANADRQTYKAALASALAKAQRSMLGNKTGSTSASANTLRGQGVQAGLAQQATSAGNIKRPALYKDADGEKSSSWSSGKPSGSWADIGTAASRRQERDPEARAWKGEVLPQRDASATPRRAAIAVYRDSDDEGEDCVSPVKERAADVFSKSSEPSDTDKLRRNPFLHYEPKDVKPAASKTSTSRPRPQEADVKVKKARQDDAASKPAASSSKASKAKTERYAVAVEQLYPGVPLASAGQRSSSKKRSNEVSLEELICSRMGNVASSSSDDPWAHLDALQGKWLPEIEVKAPIVKAPRLIQRDPTVTAFTRAAQDEVLQMFNGGLEASDEESSDEESESEEEDEGGMPRTVLGAASKEASYEQENVPFASSSTQASAFPAATPQRRPFGELVREAHADQPRRVERQPSYEPDDEDSREDVHDVGFAFQDYMNRPMCELAPLSPITEATEYTRTTQLSRTPGATSSSRFASRSWTPSSQRVEEQREIDEGNDTRDEAEQSHLGEEQHPVVDARPALEIDDKQPLCPTDEHVIATILSSLELPVESSADYVDCSQVSSSKLKMLQKHAASLTKRRTSGHTLSSVQAPECILDVASHRFCIRQKLGEGGYGAVFLAEDPSAVSGRQQALGGINGDASFADLAEEEHDDSMDAFEPKLIAIKVESPPNRWEFYILGQLRARLANQPDRLASIICARKFFCFQDESFLLLEYGDKGTLLEIVNHAVSAGVASSSIVGLGSSAASAGAQATTSTGNAVASSAVGVDEILAMFFTVEIIKLVEALHATDLLHGDLKIDNCLLRLDESDCTWTHAYSRHGDNGWASRGITLIDFGRAVDLRRFAPEQRFVADWTPEAHDMPQIQRGESWRHEIDYFGIASIAYCLLFGKYIAVVPSAKDNEAYVIDKPLRRYWQIDTWNALFSLCLNCPQDGAVAAAGLQDVRTRMETWLEANCFRAGKNLKGSLKKLEIWTMKRTM